LYRLNSTIEWSYQLVPRQVSGNFGKRFIVCSAYDPVLKRIKFLMGKGLTSMMVLFDILSWCITPLQQSAHTTWLYTGRTTPHD
jgi:hypothetical protein